MVDRREQLVDLVEPRGRAVDRAGVRRVRRADQPVVGPRHEEHDLARHADRQADVARDPRSRHDQVSAPARQEPGRPARQRRRRVGSPDTGGVHDRPCPDLVLLARQAVTDACPDDSPAVLDQRFRARARHDRGSVLTSRPGDRQGVARVVLDAVVEHQAAPQPFATHRGRVLEHLADRQVAVPAAVPPCAEHVVQGHPGLIEDTRHDRQAEEREQQRLDRHEVGCEVEDSRALRQRLADQAEAVLLEIAQPAVDQPRRPRRRPDGDVVALHQPHPQAARGRVQGGTGAHDPAADDEHVERPVDEGGQVAPTSLERPEGHRSMRPGRLIRHRTAAVPPSRTRIRTGVRRIRSRASPGSR